MTRPASERARRLVVGVMTATARQDYSSRAEEELLAYVAALENVASDVRHLKRVHEAGNDAADARSALWCALAALDSDGGAT